MRPLPQVADIRRAWVGPPRRSALPPHGSDFGVQHEDTEAFRQRAARECLDTLGMLRSYRAPQDVETWLIPARSEQRLLAQVRALLMLGPPALTLSLKLALDPDVPDPDRVFANLFLLGCTSGVEALSKAVPIFEAAQMRDRGEAAAAVEAFCLSPSQALTDALSPLLTHAMPQVRAAAVRVLAYREALSTPAWSQAMRDADPRVVAAALGGSVNALDRDQCAHMLQAWYGCDQEPLARAALRAGLSLRLDEARVAARAIAAKSPAWADSLYLLALCGQAEDASLIEAAFQLHWPSAVKAAAHAGWLGLGARMVGWCRAHPQQEPLCKAVHQALRILVGLPGEIAPDAEAMTQTWLSLAADKDVEIRWRGGQAWHAGAALQALRDGAFSRVQRQDLYLELQMMSPGLRLPRFSAFDFIGVQWQSLEAIAASLFTH